MMGLEIIILVLKVIHVLTHGENLIKIDLDALTPMVMDIVILTRDGFLTPKVLPMHFPLKKVNG